MFQSVMKRDESGSGISTKTMSFVTIAFAVVLVCGVVVTMPKHHSKMAKLQRMEQAGKDDSLVKLAVPGDMSLLEDEIGDRLTNLEYSQMVGNSGGTGVAFMPMVPMQAVRFRVSGGLLTGVRLKTLGWGPWFGSTASWTQAAAPGSTVCLADARLYYSSSQIEGMQTRFCRTGSGTSTYAVSGSSSGTDSGWVFGNGCGACDAGYANSRYCIIGMSGMETEGSLVRSLSFVQACVLFD